MSAMASQITGVSSVYSTVCSGADQRKHQSSVSLAFVRGIHQGPVNSLHKGPVRQKMFPFDDIIMIGNHSLCLRSVDNSAIVPFHKSQCALRCRDPMSKIQNTSSQRSLATWLTVAANEQNDDWPASGSLVSVQPVIRWLKDEVARHWSHIVHRPRPHGNLPLPGIVRNGV